MDTYVHTVLTRPKLTESWPQPKLRSAFCVCFSSGIVDPELTPSRPKANQEQTERANPKFRSRPLNHN